MPSVYRKYIGGQELEAFKAGFAEVLGYPEPAEIIRLSLRTINKNIRVAAVVKVIDAPIGRVFEIPYSPPAGLVGWAGLGAEFGRAVQGWMRPAIQDQLRHDIAVRGITHWNYHEWEELAQDMIDEWEELNRAHLSGKLHPLPKSAIITKLGATFLAIVEQKDRELDQALQEQTARHERVLQAAAQKATKPKKEGAPRGDH